VSEQDTGKRASVNSLPFEPNGYDLHLRLCLNRPAWTIPVGFLSH
jgi:hypothetical protein